MEYVKIESLLYKSGVDRDGIICPKDVLENAYSKNALKTTGDTIPITKNFDKNKIIGRIVELSYENGELHCKGIIYDESVVPDFSSRHSLKYITGIAKKLEAGEYIVSPCFKVNKKRKNKDSATIFEDIELLYVGLIEKRNI